MSDGELDTILALRAEVARLKRERDMAWQENRRLRLPVVGLHAVEQQREEARGKHLASEERAEKLAALLRTARQWHGHDAMCDAVLTAELGVVEMSDCDCGWRELAADIDAALAGQP